MKEDYFELIERETNIVRYKILANGIVTFEFAEIEKKAYLGIKAFIEFVAKNKQFIFLEYE